MARSHARQAAVSPSARVLGALSFIAAVALLLAVPLVFDGQAIDMFRGPKSELALAAWAALAAVFAIGNLGGSAWRDRWWPAWAGVLAGGAVSALACPAPARALASLVPVALAALGWGALRQLSDRRRESLVRLVVWAGALESALVLLFLVPSWQPQVFSQLMRGGRFAWIGTFGNPGEVAIFLALPALLAAQHAIGESRRRAAWAAAAVLMSGVLLATGTLSAAAALLAGGAVLAWRRTAPALRLRVIAAVVAAALVLAVATPLSRRVAAAINEARHGGWIWLGSARGAAYAAVGSMLADRPLTGVGFGLFEANSFRSLSQDTLADRGRVLGMETGFGEAHNDPLQYAAETGVLGLLLAAAGVALAVRRQGTPGGGLVDPAPLAAAAAVVAVTQFPLHLAAVAAQWAVVAALALPPLPAPPDPAGWVGRARVLAVGILVGIGALVAWERARAEVAFGQAGALAEQLRASQARPALRAEVARAALANLQLRRRWLPYSWEAALTTGNVAVQAGDTRAALDAFGRALTLADRPEVRFDVGMALLMSGDREEGLSHLVKAVQLNPSVFAQIKDPALSRELRGRLDASGYGAKHPWMFKGTPAEHP